MLSPKRYTIVVADRSTGVIRRFTLSLRPTLLGIGLAFSLPVLIGLGARWSAKAEIETAIKDVRDSLTSEDAGEIRSRSDALQAAFQKVSEEIYSQAADQQAAASGDGADASQNGAGDEEEVVDAEVVDDEKTS